MSEPIVSSQTFDAFPVAMISLALIGLAIYLASKIWRAMNRRLDNHRIPGTLPPPKYDSRNWSHDWRGSENTGSRR